LPPWLLHPPLRSAPRQPLQPGAQLLRSHAEHAPGFGDRLVETVGTGEYDDAGERQPRGESLLRQAPPQRPVIPPWWDAADRIHGRGQIPREIRPPQPTGTPGGQLFRPRRDTPGDRL